MGVFADLLSVIPSTSALAVFLNDQLRKQTVDPTNTQVAANAVHTVKQFATDPTGGTFTLTVTLRSGETFTTAGIAYNANAATIESAIDTAATAASITGWTNGDISVSGGNLLAAGADVVLTFDGTSVAGLNHSLTTIDGSSLTGGSLDSPSTVVTTAGQTARPALGALMILGVVGGTPQIQQADTLATLTMTKGDNLAKVPGGVVLELCKQSAIEDSNNAAYYNLLKVLEIQDKAELISHTGNRTRGES